MTSRDDLVERLLDTRGTKVVFVSAPGGYGKTTTIRLWEEADGRPFTWVRVQPSDDHAVHLVQHIALSLQEAEPLGRRLLQLLSGPGRSVVDELLPVLGHELARRRPSVLVFDDLHVLGSPLAARCIEDLLAWVPEGWQVVLVSRLDSPVGLARYRMTSDVYELAAADLAMSDAMADRLLRRSGLALDAGTVSELVRRTEGWPGGLHLAALALSRRGGRRGDADLSGSDRLIADYLVEEVLSGLPGELTTFLEESSVLERMNPRLLDDLLGTDRSAERLDEIDRVGRAALLVPLDDERDGYRYHHLLAEVLAHRLWRRDPQLARRLEGRASLLLEGEGDADGAIRHAVRAGDPARAADLILGQVPRLVATGRSARLEAWLDLLGPEGVEGYPGVAVAWGWVGLARGDVRVVSRGVAAADRMGDRGPLADGTPSLSAAIGVVRAMAGLGGLRSVVRDAEAARAGGPTANPWWAVATLLRGVACFLLGDVDRAREPLRAAYERVSHLPGFEAVALAHLGLIALHDDDLLEADRLASRAVDLARRNDLDGLPMLVPVFALGALTAARRGRADEADRAAATASRLLTGLGDLSPAIALLGHLLLAQTALALGRIGESRARLDEAQRVRRRDPSATYVVVQLDELQQLGDAPGLRGVGVQPLTGAELRVLVYLPTHLSLQEIAQRLFISRNTAKTHSVSIYRKLGVSSRSEAVETARRYGLLRDAQPVTPI